MRLSLVALAVVIAGGFLMALSAPSALGSGRVDHSFGNDGVVRRLGPLGLGGALGVAEDGHGRLVAVGNAGPERAQYFVVRFLPNGSRDSTFGDDGDAHYPNRGDVAKALAIGRNGMITLAGSDTGDGTAPRTWCASVSRLTSDGAPATGFGYRHSSRKRICSNGPGFAGKDVALSRRGKILIGGTIHSSNFRSGGFVARLRSKGKFDHSFRGDRHTRSVLAGAVRLMPPRRHYGSIEAVKALPGGKILAGGYLRGRFMVVRLRSDGGFDRSFGRGGIARFDLDGRKGCECSFGKAMIRDSRGRILLAGSIRHRRHGVRRLVVIRLHPDGRLDRSFGKRGVARPGVASFRTTGVALQRDGRILVSGLGKNGGLVRLNPGGSLDRTFFSHGRFTKERFGGYVWDVLVDRKGRIVVSGGNSGFTLMRLHPGP